MTEREVAKIEHALGEPLPAAYRETLLDYPFPGYCGSDDFPLFDRAEALIELNRQYHEGYADIPPWPESLLFVGDDGAASTYAIDRADPQLRVVLLDHGHPDRILESYDRFDLWLADLAETFGDLTDQPRHPLTWQRVVLLVVTTAVIAGVFGYVLSRLLAIPLT